MSGSKLSMNGNPDHRSLDAIYERYRSSQARSELRREQARLRIEARQRRQRRDLLLQLSLLIFLIGVVVYVLYARHA